LKELITFYEKSKQNERVAKQMKFSKFVSKIPIRVSDSLNKTPNKRKSFLNECKEKINSHFRKSISFFKSPLPIVQEVGAAPEVKRKSDVNVQKLVHYFAPKTDTKAPFKKINVIKPLQIVRENSELDRRKTKMAPKIYTDTDLVMKVRHVCVSNVYKWIEDGTLSSWMLTEYEEVLKPTSFITKMRIECR
jgi:hypothetical protein